MFRILGTLALDGGDRCLPLGPPKQQLTLAVLLCKANLAVSTDYLIDAVWEGTAPRTARKNLQVYVSALRKIVDSADEDLSICSTVTGYRLSVAPSALDWLEFDRLARAGDSALRAGQRDAAALLMDQALSLWRERPLAEFCDNSEIAQAAESMTRRRISVVEDWADTVIALGEPKAALERLEEAVLLDPMRDRLRALQISALVRLGMRAQALSVYDEVRRELSREYGLEPGPVVEAARQLALAHERPVVRRAPVSRCPVLLPPDPPAFIGRRDLLEKLGVLLRPAGRVVLHGPIGIGKTCLAVRAARASAAQFGDGCIFVSLTNAQGLPRPLESVLTELWHVAGIATILPDDMGAAAAVWRAHLATRHLLLVFDDVPSESAAAPLLPDAGTSTVVLTSRPALSNLDVSTRLAVRPLSHAEAWELLAAFAGHERLAAEPDAADLIIEACGATPSAIRAAGTRLSAMSTLRLTHIAHLLDNAQQRLNLLAPDPQTLVELRRSWESRTPQTLSAALRHLGTLGRRCFDVQEAQRVWGLAEPTPAYDRIGRLVYCGLVTESTAEVTAHAKTFEIPSVVWWLLKSSSA